MSQWRNELEAQRRTTAFTLRKRHHQEEQACSELEWQLRKVAEVEVCVGPWPEGARQMFLVMCLQTEEEMAEMEADVHELDADLQAKTASLKLAHTRLEKRSGRAGVDLCRDQVRGPVPAWSRRLQLSAAHHLQLLPPAGDGWSDP